MPVSVEGQIDTTGLNFIQESMLNVYRIGYFLHLWLWIYKKKYAAYCMFCCAKITFESSVGDFFEVSPVLAIPLTIAIGRVMMFPLYVRLRKF